MSMCPYKRPYNSGTIRVRLLPLPTVITALTCGNRPVGYSPAPSFPPSFRFPKPCAQVRILPGAPLKVQLGERGHDREAAPKRHGTGTGGPPGQGGGGRGERAGGPGPTKRGGVAGQREGLWRGAVKWGRSERSFAEHNGDSPFHWVCGEMPTLHHARRPALLGVSGILTECPFSWSETRPRAEFARRSPISSSTYCDWRMY